ncbi:Txe/YoeB family addiction module toxin [Pseudomonas sp. GX19020]|uniref:Txe/YoeB family addiction module toxin n=1 Tax=Pseudomonas sp. GX19020 TaxID=2942277 RepID=UPI0020194329|nr:Txe/YoeB family addiction module toxin [Pseudomonas sp. GX19020]MCL4069319.1 Txe/YoeB family addiction module toxin [Pseudomonas sp. GX19020]
MRLTFSDAAWDDYHHWRQTDAKLFQRINDLIKEAQRSPFKGTGKPEPLKGDLSGWWSRRITSEHRMVYRVAGKDQAQALEIAQLRYHY